ncbi:MAG: hypothetical protein D9V47_06265 [Clostridia bacterium]|nr:MAG: hypothetical protein D9V47_06265 [Clostridia bacterium]
MPNKQWHPAFVAAVREALKDAPPGEVEVIPEVALSSKPLGVDVLVVKKSEETKLVHPIAKIFRRYNLFEPIFRTLMIRG